jgi:hypothetical protein
LYEKQPEEPSSEAVTNAAMKILLVMNGIPPLGNSETRICIHRAFEKVENLPWRSFWRTQAHKERREFQLFIRIFLMLDDPITLKLFAGSFFSRQTLVSLEEKTDVEVCLGAA